VDAARMKRELVAVFDRTAEEFDQGEVAFFGPMGRRLVELAGIKPGERVLDIGSGRGAVLFPAAEAVGVAGEVVGIDLAGEMVRHLRADIERRGVTNAGVRLMDGEAPDFPPGSFDAIVGSFSIVLLPNVTEALPRYRPLLRPGGRLAFSSPRFSADGTFTFLPRALYALFETLMESAAEQMKGNPFADPNDSWLSSSDRIRATLEAAGYSRVTVHEENSLMVARSGEEWLRWSKTTGMRIAYDLVPEAERPALESRIVGEIEALRTPDGTIEVPAPVSFVVAHP
jgi:O-methyltransferase / aklanonic acid methyltransferase